MAQIFQRTLFLMKCLFAVLAVSTAASAEARYTQKGFPIDPDVWIEDARIDPLMYFVFPISGLSKHNKCNERFEADKALEFFRSFNALVIDRQLDDLDVRIVWTMRDCLSNDAMIEALGVSRNTYFDRMCRIRRLMRASFAEKPLECIIHLEN